MEKIEILRVFHAKNAIAATLTLLFAIYIVEWQVFPNILAPSLPKDAFFILQLLWYGLAVLCSAGIAESALRAKYAMEFLRVEGNSIIFECSSSLPIPWFNSKRSLRLDELEAVGFVKGVYLPGKKINSASDLSTLQLSIAEDDIMDFARDAASTIMPERWTLVIIPKKGTPASKVRMIGVEFAVPNYSIPLNAEQVGNLKEELKGKVSELVENQ